MLLTIKQPSNHGFKSFHDYSPPTPPSTSRFSPALISSGPSYPPSLQATSKTNGQPMSTPHRGLPPPAAMTLSQPSQGPPQLGSTPALGQALGQLPAPPQQWQGAEESMRNWLHAKAEEDKRKQEEEKTRQESLRLEQRKIESEMLTTSLNGGIPPYMIPMVFAGMGGGNLPAASLEWAQHYLAQTQPMQQPQLQPPNPPPAPPSPGLRRESRQISHPVYIASQNPSQAQLPSTPIGPPAPQSGFYPMSPTQRSRAQLPGPSALSRAPQSSQLPRLNTAEMHILQPSQGPPNPQQSLPGQPQNPQQPPATQSSQQESQSSPSIYFHHWQPPTSQAGSGGGNQPMTPSDMMSTSQTSPKKRKAQGTQERAPPPTSQPQYTSPPFSQSTSGPPSGRRRGHSRQRSDTSAREYGRPRSRHQHTESGISTQSAASPSQHPSYDSPLTSGQTEGTSGSHRTSHRPGSIGERMDPRQHQMQQHYPESHYSVGPEMRRDTGAEPGGGNGGRISPRGRERERGREGVPLPPPSSSSSSSRLYSGKRDDPRD